MLLPSFDKRRLVEWQHKQYIAKLRNRYYCFYPKDIDEYFLYLISNRIYAPSYISLESALAFYNIIPEGVFSITSITTRKTSSFKIPFCTAMFSSIKATLFFGYKLIEYERQMIKIASFEKAILDFLYLHPSIKQIEDFVALRWNKEVIRQNIKLKKLDFLLTKFSSQALNKRIIAFKSYVDIT